MIHLASNSKSRALLLKRANIEFIQKAPKYNEEQIKTNIAKDFVYLASRGKLESAIKEFGLELPLLTADSVISTSDGKILRKPKDINEAREILNLQSNSNISIISAMHLKSKKFYLVDISATYYKFSTFNRDDLEAYLESGEWRGKAGGCMVEGFCKKYIESVRGYETTAMGLQIEKLGGWLKLMRLLSH